MRLISRAFALSLSLASIGASAQWWDPTDMTPPYLKGTPAAQAKVVYNQAKKQTAGQVMNAAFWNGDFGKLERMYDEFLTQKVRAADGTWMVNEVQRTFDYMFSGIPEERAQKVMDTWQAAVPNSKLRPVVEAMRWQRMAWDARGGGSRGQTPDEAMKVFRQHLAHAAKALEASADVGKDSPIWYWVALIVAGSSGRPAAQFDALFEEAVSKFPSYQPLYYTRVNYMLPQWGGNYRQVDEFVAHSVTRTAQAEGESMYAWIYADLAYKQSDLFEDSAVSWPHMRHAFDDLVKRYPDAINKSRYLAFACHLRDRDTTARLLQEMGNRAEVYPLFNGVNVETCRRFALQPA